MPRQQFFSGFKREVSLPSSFLLLSGISQSWHEGNHSTCQLVLILCSSTKNTYSVTMHSLPHEKLVLIYRWRRRPTELGNLPKMTRLQWSWNAHLRLQTPDPAPCSALMVDGNPGCSDLHGVRGNGGCGWREQPGPVLLKKCSCQFYHTQGCSGP